MEEAFKALALIVGTVLASGLFQVGFRIWRAGGANWQEGRRKICETLAVNLKTRQWVVAKTISEEGVDQMLGEPGRSAAC